MFIVNTAQERCFLATVDGSDVVEFQFVPNEMDDARTNKLVNIPVVGRSNDQFQYVGGEDTLNLTLTFYADDDNRENAMKSVRLLKALGMNNAGFGPARRLKLIMGNLYPREVWSLKRVSSQLKGFDKDNDYLPIYATVNLQLVLNPVNNRRRRDVTRL